MKKRMNPKIKVPKKSKSRSTRKLRSTVKLKSFVDLYEPILRVTRSAKKNMTKVKKSGQMVHKRLKNPTMRQNTLKKWRLMAILIKNKRKNLAARQNYKKISTKYLRSG